MTRVSQFVAIEVGIEGGEATTRKLPIPNKFKWQRRAAAAPAAAAAAVGPAVHRARGRDEADDGHDAFGVHHRSLFVLCFDDDGRGAAGSEGGGCGMWM